MDRQEAPTLRQSTAPGVSFAEPLGINNSGEVVEYTSGGGYTYLNGSFQLLPGDVASANAINSLGQIAGFVRDGLVTQPYLYSNGTVTKLGGLTATTSFGMANGINDSGVLVGNSGFSAFVYSNGTMSAIPSLGQESIACAINQNGEVVGQGNVPSSTYEHAFAYQNGITQDLGTLGNPYDSVAYALNDQGVIVGRFGIATGLQVVYHGFIYTSSGMADLNSLVPSNVFVSAASGINDDGQIIGTGTVNGVSAAFILTPVPEPPVGIFVVYPMLVLLVYERKLLNR